MDVTLATVKGNKSGSSLKQDPWDGVMVKDECIFCKHSVNEHKGMSLMVWRPNQSRRTRAGLAFVGCIKCAQNMKTEQVMCYQHPSEFTDMAKANGYKYAPTIYESEV